MPAGGERTLTAERAWAGPRSGVCSSGPGAEELSPQPASYLARSDSTQEPPANIFSPWRLGPGQRGPRAGSPWGSHLPWDPSPPPTSRRPAQPPPALRAQPVPGTAMPAACRLESSPTLLLARYHSPPASAPLGTQPAEPPPLASPGTAARARAVAHAKTDAFLPTAPARPRSRAPAGSRATARSLRTRALVSSGRGAERRAGREEGRRGPRAASPGAGPSGRLDPQPGSAAPPSTRLGSLPASRQCSRGAFPLGRRRGPLWLPCASAQPLTGQGALRRAAAGSRDFCFLCLPRVRIKQKRGVVASPPDYLGKGMLTPSGCCAFWVALGFLPLRAKGVPYCYRLLFTERPSFYFAPKDTKLQ